MIIALLIGVALGLVIGLLFKEHLLRDEAHAAGVCLDCVLHRPCAVPDREPRQGRATSHDGDPWSVPQC